MAENNELERTLWQAKLYSGFAVERYQCQRADGGVSSSTTEAEV